MKITTDFNIVGWGEASPSSRVTGENTETVIKCLDIIAPRLIGMCPLRIEQVSETMNNLVENNPSAKASIDIALHDILGKTVEKPLFRVLEGIEQKPSLM